MDLSQAFLEAMVDDRPEYLSGPGLQYPRVLREARIEGDVLLEFVVDTLGRAEPPSIRVIESTNRAFEGAAFEAIRGSRYRAGRVRGVAVRVLVRQRLEFSLAQPAP